MRTLNIKQKRILDKFIQENKEILDITFEAEHLDDDLYQELININNFEFFDQKVKRYVIDQMMKESK